MIFEYAQYVEDCKKEFEETMNPSATLIEYHRVGHGRPKGVLVVFKDEYGHVLAGHSLCHRTEKRGFNKYVGLVKAMNKAIPIESLGTPSCVKTNAFISSETSAWKKVPHSLRKHMKKLIQRAYLYFKDALIIPVNTEGEVELPADATEYSAKATKVSMIPSRNLQSEGETGYSFTDEESGPSVSPELEPYMRKL
jgi:hypothetical protein